MSNSIDADLLAPTIVVLTLVNICERDRECSIAELILLDSDFFHQYRVNVSYYKIVYNITRRMILA